MSKLPTVAKAIAAGLTAFGGALGTALTDGVVTTAEWVTVAVATLVAAASVYQVRNAPDGRHEATEERSA